MPFKIGIREQCLPVGYFHVVFTIPSQLNPFALRNKRVFYNLMFRAVKETILELSANEKHLGAYTHRVAISDSRIEHFENGRVTFSYKDYADNSRVKSMELDACEFIRRFLLHVIPQGYKRIRYFGFLAPRARAKRFERCRAFFKMQPRKKRERKVRPWYETVKELTGKDPLRCVACGIGRLRCVATLPRMPMPLALLSGG